MPFDITADPNGNLQPIAPSGSDPLTAASAEGFIQRLANKDAELDGRVTSLEAIKWIPLVLDHAVLADYVDESGFGTPDGIFFSTDGSRLFIVDSPARTIDQYDLETAWDQTSTATPAGSFAFPVASDPRGLVFRDDGTRFYTVQSQIVREFDCSTAWDVTTASAGGSIDLSSDVIQGFDIGDNGSKMFTYSSIGGTPGIRVYDLSTAWSISTASYSGNSYTDAFSSNGSGLVLSKDGMRVVTSDTGVSTNVNQYSMSVPWDITTMFTPDISLDTQSYLGAGSDLSMCTSTDGSKFYIISRGEIARFYTTQAVFGP